MHNSANRDDENIHENTKVTQQDKINMLKELATFALIGLGLFVFQLILPPVLRFIINLF